MKPREWFCADLFMADASALLAQMVALDETSFEYLFDLKLQQWENQDLHAIAEDYDYYFRLFDDDLLQESLVFPNVLSVLGIPDMP